MGEIADMMLDGTMCQVCGEFMDGGADGDGFPVTCAACDDGTSVEPEPVTLPKIGKHVACPDASCERKFINRHAAAMHWIDKH